MKKTIYVVITLSLACVCASSCAVRRQQAEIIEAQREYIQLLEEEIGNDRMADCVMGSPQWCEVYE